MKYLLMSIVLLGCSRITQSSDFRIGTQGTPDAKVVQFDYDTLKYRLVKQYSDDSCKCWVVIVRKIKEEEL
jgi:hypothetical protein